VLGLYKVEHNLPDLSCRHLGTGKVSAEMSGYGDKLKIETRIQNLVEGSRLGENVIAQAKTYGVVSFNAGKGLQAKSWGIQC
jgi:hypothetical protein